MDENYLHPIITQDMRNFGMEASTFDTSFYNFPIASLPLPQTVNSHQHGTNSQFMMSDAVFPPFTMNFEFGQRQDESNFYSDVAWQSFVGELGI